MRVVKPIIKYSLVLLAIILLVVLSYLAYVILTYDRIEDNVPLTVEGEAKEERVLPGTEYTIVTQNLGFGAYVQDFTFFMDGGKESRARSKEGVIECINDAMDEVGSYDPDFILFQEVDIDSTRSYHVDQYRLLSD